jgi:hypothetical protein
MICTLVSESPLFLFFEHGEQRIQLESSCGRSTAGIPDYNPPLLLVIPRTVHAKRNAVA